MKIALILLVQGIIVIIINGLWHHCHYMPNIAKAKSIQDTLLLFMIFLGLLGVGLDVFVFHSQDSLYAFVCSVNPAVLYFNNLLVVRARKSIEMYMSTYLLLLWQIVLLPLWYDIFYKEIFIYSVIAMILSLSTSFFYVGTGRYEVQQ